jgi:hypothetical protein
VKGAGGDKDLAAQLQAYQTAGGTPAQLHEAAAQFIQRKDAAETRDAALKAHTEAMTGKIAQQHLALLKRNLDGYAKQIKAADDAVKEGSDDPKEVAAMTAHAAQLRTDQTTDQTEYDELRQAAKPQATTQPTTQPGQTHTPEEASKLPKGTTFTGVDGQQYKVR